MRTSTTYPSLCTYNVEDVVAVSNLSTSVLLNTVDYHGNPRTNGGDPVTANLTKEGSPARQPSTKVEDLDNGSYRISFRPTSPGKWVSAEFFQIKAAFFWIFETGRKIDRNLVFRSIITFASNDFVFVFFQVLTKHPSLRSHHSRLSDIFRGHGTQQSRQDVRDQRVGQGRISAARRRCHRQRKRYGMSLRLPSGYETNFDLGCDVLINALATLSGFCGCPNF